jgi:branched-chain amino acid transport system permease protein
LNQFLTATVIGLASAGIFAIAASGLVLTYVTTGIFNFAHGAIGMLGAFTFWQLHVDWGWPTWLALPVVLFVLAPLLGVLIEVTIMRGLQNAPEVTRLVVSVGLLAGMLAVGFWLWSPQDSHPIDVFWPGHRLSVLGVNLSWHLLLALGLSAAVAGGLRLLLYGTRAGITMRATVDDRPLASLNGARPDRSAALAWAIGCSLAALAGILIAPTLTLSHTLLTLLIVDAYAAAVIGRLRSLPLTFLGAAIIGLSRSYVITYLPDPHPGAPGYARYLQSFPPAVPVVILFIVLLLLPQSRLRIKGAMRTVERQPRPEWSGALLLAGSVVGVAIVVAMIIAAPDADSAARVFGLAIIALSLVPLVGYAGQISLCQMSFAGIGALTYAHLAPGGSPLGLVAAAVVTGAVGAVVALPALRLSGIYLALSTGAFALFLDRWVFTWPTAHLGGLQVSFFGLGSITVPRLSLPGVDAADHRPVIVELAVAFALLSLVVVAIRRSSFGDRLLAMKDSPAACATLGLDLTTTKLAVFALSAAMAGVGGALYATAFGAVSAPSFSLFQSLPILLVSVAGGIARPGGALFGGLALGSIPVLAKVAPRFTNLFAFLPATIGITLGRSPNGVATELSDRVAPLRRSPLAFGLVVAGVAALGVLAIAGAITGWVFTLGSIGVVLVGMGVTTAPSLLGAAAEPVELLGIDRPFAAADVERIDEALSLPDLVLR